MRNIEVNTGSRCFVIRIRNEICLTITRFYKFAKRIYIIGSCTE